MKVKEVIKLEGWVDGSGRSWQDTYAENIIEIKESELPKTANDYDWSWYELPEENPDDSGEDTKIIVEFYAEDAEPGWDEPLAKISKWESDLWKERNTRIIMFKVFDTAEINGKKFAILINDNDMTAHEAVEIDGKWVIDFDYPSIGVDSFDVAGTLNFEGANKAGYRFN